MLNMVKHIFNIYFLLYFNNNHPHNLLNIHYSLNNNYFNKLNKYLLYLYKLNKEIHIKHINYQQQYNLISMMYYMNYCSNIKQEFIQHNLNMTLMTNNFYKEIYMKYIYQKLNLHNNHHHKFLRIIMINLNKLMTHKLNKQQEYHNMLNKVMYIQHKYHFDKINQMDIHLNISYYKILNYYCNYYMQFHLNKQHNL